MSNVRQLPLIPLRDMVFFPQSEVPIYVGREASMRAIKLAKSEYGGEIVVFTQLRGEDHGPIDAGKIHQIGTLARIVAMVETTDQTIKAMMEGTERVRLVDLKVVDGVTMVTVTPEPELDKDVTIDESEHAALLALLSAWEPDLNGEERVELRALTTSRDIVSVVTALRTLTAGVRIDKPGAERVWPSAENSAPARYHELRNHAVARRQRVLEEPRYHQKLKCLVDSLEFDIACRSEEF